MRLQASEGEDSPEARAQRLFSMAEMQLFQFDDTQKALEGYQELVAQYPQSEFAPKAAYAIAYVYGEVQGDSVKATRAYQSLINAYPDSQQADIAREALGLPPLERARVSPVDADSTDSASLEGAESP